MRKRPVIILLICFIVLVVLIGLVKHRLSIQSLPVIEPENFEQCSLIYPVMETYPEQCSTPSGKNFVKEGELPTSSTTTQLQATSTTATTSTVAN